MIREPYVCFADELESRLDYDFYHPQFEILSRLRDITSYEVTSISECVESSEGIVSGSTPPDIEYGETGIPFLGSTNIQGGFLALDSVINIPRGFHDGVLRGSQLQRGDVLVSMAGHYIGKCCIFDIDLPANINQAVARLRADKRTRPGFLLRYLESRLGQLAFSKYQHVVGQPNINLDEIGQIPIIRPNITVQDNILKKVEPIVREALALRAKSAHSLLRAQATFAEEIGVSLPQDVEFFFALGAREKTSAFHRFPAEGMERLDIFSNDPDMETIVEALRARYDLVKLADIVKEPIHRGEQPRYSDDGEVLVIKTVDLGNGYISYDDCLRVSREFFDSEPSAHVKANDVLLTSTGYRSLGKADVFSSDVQCMVDGHISIITVNDDYDPYFIAAFLRSEFGKAQIERWWSGSSGQIEIQPFEVGQLLVPSKKSLKKRDQQRIANAVTKALTDARSLSVQAKEKMAELNTTFESFLLN